MLGELHCSAGRSHALGRDRVLDRHRETVERAEHLAPSPSVVGRRRGMAGTIGVDGDDCVHAVAIQPLDALQIGLEQVAGGEDS